MFCDLLDNISPKIYQLHPLFKSAFKWISNNLETLPPIGRSTLSEGIIAIVDAYNTMAQEEKDFENHRKFIDIQVLTKGVEYIYWTKMNVLDNFICTAEYSVEQDIEFYRSRDEETDFSRILLKPGMFVIFWPGDWHKPCITPFSSVKRENRNIFSNKIHKFVMKVPVDLKF